MVDPIPVEERVSVASFRWTIPLAFTALLTSLSLLRYHLYLATGWDFGFYEQGLWSLSVHGPAALSSWGGYPVLARSGAFILWPLAFFYRLLGADFLLVLQAFCYGSGYLFLMDLAQKWNASWSSTRLLGWVYLLSPIAWGAALFDFHPEFLAVPALLAALSASERARPRAAIIWLILALACQDQVSLVVIAGGLALVLAGRPSTGWGAVGIGLLAVLGDWAALHALDPGVWVQTSLYFTQGPWVRQFVHNLRETRTALYLVWVLAPTLLFGVTRRSWMWFLPALPILALNLGSPNPATTSPFTQYSVLLLPSLFVEWLSAQAKPQWISGFKRAGAVVAVVALFLVYVGHQSEVGRQIPPRTQNAALIAAIAAVPAGAPVYCQNFVAPRLPNRETLRPIRAGEVFPAGAYVVLDTGHSTGLVNIRVVQADVVRLTKYSRTRFSEDGVYVLQMRETVRGVS